MLRKIVVVISLIISPIFVNAQQASPLDGLVEWISIEEALKRNERIPKPIIIDFYTDWCGWCKKMIKTTYSDPNTATYINNYFYPVKFNAEGKDTVTYLGKVYKPTSDAPKAPHEFALELMQGAMSYPTTLFLHGFDATKNAFAMNMRAPGYMDVTKIEPLLVFSVENAYRNSNYDDFQAGFETAFSDTTINEKMSEINWIAPAEAFSENSTNNKKSIVLVHTEWCNTCKVLQRASFTDDIVSAYVDSAYRIINFNPEITDTLFLDGNKFINEKQPQLPFHQLSIALCKNNLIIPTMALLDENNKLMDAIPFYLPPVLLNKVLRFYGDDIYKTKSWNDYFMESQ